MKQKKKTLKSQPVQHNFLVLFVLLNQEAGLFEIKAREEEEGKGKE